MAVVNNGSRSQAAKMFDLAMNRDEQVGHMMNELEQVQDTLAIAWPVQKTKVISQWLTRVALR